MKTFTGSCGKNKNIDLTPALPDYKPIKAPTGIRGEIINGNNSLVLPNTVGPIGFFIFEFKPNYSGIITIDVKNTFLLNLINCTSPSKRNTTAPVLKWYEYIEGNENIPILVNLDDDSWNYHFIESRKYILEVMIPKLKVEYGDCKHVEAYLQVTLNH